MTRAFRHLRECFGCGADNPVSPGVVVRATDDGAEARVRFGRDHQGAPGLVHGGLLATLLDETMGTVPFDRSGVRLTAEMTVRYLRPTPIETDLVCRARVGEVSARGFSVEAAVTAVDDPEVVLVRGEAVYVSPGAITTEDLVTRRDVSSNEEISATEGRGPSRR